MMDYYEGTLTEGSADSDLEAFLMGEDIAAGYGEEFDLGAVNADLEEDSPDL